ncbi:MAG: serpin family protein [Verrucomicrobiae bacterium]|nr:serpin family protein [Verrucomicrobiae bacterium]
MMMFSCFQNFNQQAHAGDGNDFAVNFYQQLAFSSSDNFFFSPYSFSETFSVCALGAKGKTLEEINSIFHFRSDALFKKGVDSEGVILQIANGMWVEKTLALLPEFEKRARQQTLVQIESVDFRNETEKVRNGINQWVGKRTKEKIRDLLSSGSVKPITELVIANAIYFLGKWHDPFDVQSIKEPFYCADGKEVMATYFADKRRMLYAEKEDIQVVQLDYEGEQFSMLIFLPKDRTGLSDWERQLSVDRLEDLLKALSSEIVHFRMPRFKQEFKVLANDHLQRMGLKLAFTDNADFSAMAKKPLKISDVIHQAFIEVNEKGTEAAAATAMTLEIATARFNSEPIKFFHAEHPFLFAIREKKTGQFFFMGRCMTP